MEIEGDYSVLGEMLVVAESKSSRLLTVNQTSLLLKMSRRRRKLNQILRLKKLPV
jgi:hypothetical protein